MPITADAVRYIKLGRGGCWEDVSLNKGELHFGVDEAPHELVLQGNRGLIRQHSIAAGRHPRAALEDARELFDFYFLGRDCLWVTFARDHMWWAFARPTVYPRDNSKDAGGNRVRKCIDGWSNVDAQGKPLRIDAPKYSAYQSRELSAHNM
jgi:hypothetical protein